MHSNNIKILTKKQLKNKLWKLVSKYVRTKEEKCYTCNKWLPYEKRAAGHFWTQGRHKRVMYNLMNVHTQCVSCNSFNGGQHNEYSVHLLLDYGPEDFLELEREAKSNVPLTTFELEQLINEMQKRVDNLNDYNN